VKFLIDNALSPEVARLLTAAGHDALHVGDIGLGSAEDPAILARAQQDYRVIVSADSDFAMLLAVHQHRHPSFILFREPDIIRAADYVERIQAALPFIAESLNAGCVVTFRRGRTRVRSLPFAGTLEA
jgi:predicted nuclease of predicted toxin-antitoxin system